MKEDVNINVEIEKLNDCFTVKGHFNVTGKCSTKEEAILNLKEEFELHIKELHFINK